MWQTNPATTLNRILDCEWDRNNSRGLKPWKLYGKDPNDFFCKKYLMHRNRYNFFTTPDESSIVLFVSLT